MQMSLVAFREFSGVTGAPSTIGLYPIDDVVHRLCCART
jgi:hypothetical protein